MYRLRGVLARLAAVCVIGSAVGGVLAAAPANAVIIEHGITFADSCSQPTPVGSKIRCDVGVYNDVDQDTLTFSSITAVYHAAAGDDATGNVIDQLSLSFTGGASCNVGQTFCTLPPGASITTSVAFRHHIATKPDYVDSNPLSEDLSLTWQDTCDSGANNCPFGDQKNTSGSYTEVTLPGHAVAPTKATVVKGSYTSGNASSLATSDNVDYVVASSTSGTRTAVWTGRFEGVPTSPTSLAITYEGHNTTECQQSVLVYNATTATWQRAGAIVPVGASDTRIVRFLGGTLSDYVSGAGVLLVRLRCANPSTNFSTAGDQLELTYRP